VSSTSDAVFYIDNCFTSFSLLLSNLVY